MKPTKKEITIPELELLRSKIRSAYLSICAHPDCEDGSEFDDMATGLAKAMAVIDAAIERRGNNG